MKYVLMYVSRPDLEAAVPPERQQEVYAQIYAWFGEHGSVIADDGAELQGPETATTIRSGGDGAAPVVVDGPFSEAKENIGGFSVIDVPDLDAAIELVKTWPSLALPGVSVEIRPMVEDYSEFEQSCHRLGRGRRPGAARPCRGGSDRRLAAPPDRRLRLAEEAVQEAVVAALRTWRSDGVPANPGGWLALTARRRADRPPAAPGPRTAPRRRRWRRVRRRGAAVAGRAGGAGRAVADAVRLLPSVAERRGPAGVDLPGGGRHDDAADRQRVPGPGVDDGAAAGAGQEEDRGRRIPFLIPEGEALAARLDDVLTVVYLAYNAGYLDPGGAELAGDAIWLAELVARSLPDQAEAWGLLVAADESVGAGGGALRRVRPAGAAVGAGPQPLGPRSRSDRAEGHLERAAQLRRPGRFQLQAAIAACHAEAPRWEDTDWLQILTLYDVLLLRDPSPVIRLNHAIALGQVRGAAAALAELDALAEPPRRLPPVPRHPRSAVAGARTAGRGSRRPTTARWRSPRNPAEQELLRSRIAAYDG